MRRACCLSLILAILVAGANVPVLAGAPCCRTSVAVDSSSADCCCCPAHDPAHEIADHAGCCHVEAKAGADRDDAGAPHSCPSPKCCCMVKGLPLALLSAHALADGSLSRSLELDADSFSSRSDRPAPPPPREGARAVLRA